MSVIGISDAGNLAVSLFGKKRVLLKISAGLGTIILAWPFFHLITPLLKKDKPASSFLLTQKYLNSQDNSIYMKLLVNESADAARRFFASQYIKERTTDRDKIFVWDYASGTSIVFWSGRTNLSSSVNKSFFLPKELGDPTSRLAIEEKEDDYKRRQKSILQRLTKWQPLYIVVVKTAIPIPKATFSSQEMMNLEKKAFKAFFDFLERNYGLEKDYMDCFVYRHK